MITVRVAYLNLQKYSYASLLLPNYTYYAYKSKS